MNKKFLGSLLALSALSNTALATKKTIQEPTLPASAPITVLFCHGLGGDAENADYYRDNAQLAYPIVGLDFPCSSKFTDNAFGRTCLAQQEEQQCLVDRYHGLVKKGHKVIVWGLSNGASTATTTGGCYDLKNVAAYIIESAYADPKPWVKQYGAATIPHFNPSGVCPLDVVHLIDKNIPVLFVLSKKDSIVDPDETQRLYEKLVAAGHTKVHLLVLDRGAHANLFTGKQGKTYRNAVHAFLAKYGFEHNPKYAKQYVL